jgi:signal transduction histidine kinase
MPDGRDARLSLALLATAAVAAIAVVSARNGPDWALSGASAGALAAEVATAVALVAAGLTVCLRGPDVRSGWLFALAGVLRLVAEWSNPDGAPGALVFTIGLALAAAAPAALAHALLEHSGDRRPARAAVVMAYLGAVLLLGVGPAVVSAPQSEGCPSCPADLLHLADAPDLAAGMRRWGLALLLAGLALATLLALAHVTRMSAARRRIVAPVAVPVCVASVLAAVGAAHAWSRGFLSNDPTDRRLWLMQACAVGLVALGLGLQRLRTRRVRARLAQIVVELAESPQPGRLRAALAATLGDPDLELRYSGERSHATDGGRAVTSLVRDGRAVATLVHRPGLLEDPGLVAELTRTAALTLENDRLDRELRTQLDQLRVSRAQSVAAGEAERRRIERDLHDGAQQALAGLAIGIELARVEADDPARASRLAAAQRLVREALSEVRALAHATSSAALADSGLAAALDVLAEWAPELELVRVPRARVDPAVESAAYFAVATLARRASGPVRVDAHLETGMLVVEVMTTEPPASLVEVEDRAGALDGELEIRSAEGGATVVRVALPCAS